jgi:hypothetical protein
MTVRAELILHRTSEVRDAPTGEPLVEAHAYGKLIVPDGFYRAVSIREFTQHTADGVHIAFLILSRPRTTTSSNVERSITDSFKRTAIRL